MSKESMPHLDLSEIAFALSQIALKLISGKKLETEEFTVSVSIPTEITTILRHVSEQSSTTMEELVSKMASEGIKKNLEISLEAIRQPPLIPELAQTGLDMTKITEGMNKLGELAEQLQSFQRIIDATPKNSQ